MLGTGSELALRHRTHLDFPDLVGLNPEVTLVPIVQLVPIHRRTYVGLRVKRLKEPSSSAELVLVLYRWRFTCRESVYMTL